MESFNKFRESIYNDLNLNDECLTFFTTCINNLDNLDIIPYNFDDHYNLMYNNFSDNDSKESSEYDSNDNDSEYDSNDNDTNISDSENKIKEIQKEEEVLVDEEDEDIEIITYEMTINYLDKITIIHNLISLAKLKENQKLWLYDNTKKVDTFNGYHITRWLLGQTHIKIIPCVILTINSALQEDHAKDVEINKYLIDSLIGIENLIKMYPINEELINLKDKLKKFDI